MAANVLQGAVEMAAGLLMDRNPVRPGFYELRDVLVWILNHQVAIERQLGHFTQRFHDGRPDRDIRYKMPVHDVHVHQGAAAFGGTANLVRQMGEIRRQNRRCEFDQTWALAQGDTCEILSCSDGGGTGTLAYAYARTAVRRRSAS